VSAALVERELDGRDYLAVQAAMRAHAEGRDQDAADELWWVEHPPLYTLGQTAPEVPGGQIAGMPVYRSDRGGQITWHGPGQLIAYPLLDLRRHGWGPRELVERLERSVITLLAGYQLAAHGRRDAPGVYLGEPQGGLERVSKIASIGIRVRRGCSYHGIALNVRCELSPFTHIHPCGYAGLPVTRLLDHLPRPAPELAEVRAAWSDCLRQCLLG